MASYNDIFERLKTKYNNAVLLFKNGERLEAFKEDAKIVAEVISPLKKIPNVVVAGFPTWDIDKYCPLIVSKGHKVVFCEPIANYK